MKYIKIKSQAEMDALPDSFTEYTVIQIENTIERVYVKKSYVNSSVEARGNSSVVARGNSSVEAYDFAMISVLWSTVIIKKLMDYSVASFRGFKPKIEKKAKTATVVKTPERIERSFNEWLKQGYVHADGITKKLISHKKEGSIDIYEVEEFSSRKLSYVVKSGDVFSHGKTIEEAKASLKYKLSSRGTSKYKKWKLTDVKNTSDIILAYRVITGACESGTRDFCESKTLPKKMKISDAIKLTEGKYGNEKFKEFFK